MKTRNRLSLVVSLLLVASLVILAAPSAVRAGVPPKPAQGELDGLNQRVMQFGTAGYAQLNFTDYLTDYELLHGKWLKLEFSYNPPKSPLPKPADGKGGPWGWNDQYQTNFQSGSWPGTGAPNGERRYFWPHEADFPTAYNSRAENNYLLAVDAATGWGVAYVRMGSDVAPSQITKIRNRRYALDGVDDSGTSGEADSRKGMRLTTYSDFRYFGLVRATYYYDGTAQAGALSKQGFNADKSTYTINVNQFLGGKGSKTYSLREYPDILPELGRVSRVSMNAAVFNAPLPPFGYSGSLSFSGWGVAAKACTFTQAEISSYDAQTNKLTALPALHEKTYDLAEQGVAVTPAAIADESNKFSFGFAYDYANPNKAVLTPGNGLLVRQAQDAYGQWWNDVRHCMFVESVVFHLGGTAKR